MNLLKDIITYVRRIIKSPSDAEITDDLIIDYINRFWIMDVDARIQLFDLKTTFQFQTVPGVDQYNLPLYDVQTQTGNADQDISFYPVYQGVMGPAYVNGVQVSFQTLKGPYFNIYPNWTQQNITVATGDGSLNPINFTIQTSPGNSTPQNIPIQYILRGHVDMMGIIATGANIDPIFGSNIDTAIPSTSIFPAFYITYFDEFGNSVVIQDSGQFLNDGDNKPNYGLLMVPGTAPYGYNSLGTYSTTENTINYLTGECNFTPLIAPAAGTSINVQCYFFQSGFPSQILYYNNVITFRAPPDRQYNVQMDAYLSPAAFFSTTQSIPFAYMCEYISRGAARKILADTGDLEQFQFYEPLFREQEMLVWKRSQRQFTSTRTPTIYSQGFNSLQSGGFQNGSSIF